MVSGVFFASPHSGRTYPRALLGRTILSEKQIRSSEDAFVDQFLLCAPNLGAAALLAEVPRAYIDFNRAANEMDPALIAGVEGHPVNARVRAGLGIIPRVVAGARAIYQGKLSQAEANRRIEDHWRPWHAALESLMAQMQSEFGRAILVDMHSMPSEALERGPMRPDIVLGDRFGASSAPEVTDMIEAAFEAEGLRVARNKPFAGAYIAQAHGHPTAGRHVVQVEIDRGLYMDEANIRPRDDFEVFAGLIERAMTRIVGAEASRTALAAQ
jgi:N-formylglutamate amidohydrolase